MNVTFASKFYPMAECIELLNRHCVKHLYMEDTLYRLEDENPEQTQKLLSMLDAMKDEMGSILEKKHPDKQYLFTSLFSKNVSLASAILRKCFDYSQSDVRAVKKRLLETYEQEPLIVLRALCNALYTDNDYSQSDEQTLIDLIQEADIDATVKWQVLYYYLKGSEPLEDVCLVLEDMIPVFVSYQPQWTMFLQYYEAERFASYSQGDMFSFLIDTYHFDIKKEENIYVIPSLSAYRSLEFRFDYLLDKKKVVFVQWGIGILKGLEESSQQLPLVSVCNNLKLLSDKSKFEILRYLSKQSAYGAELAKVFHLTTATITYHMQTLLDANFVRFEKKGNRIYYYTDEAFLDTFFQQVKQRMKE